MMEGINEKNIAINGKLAKRHKSLEELHKMQMLLKKMQVHGHYKGKGFFVGASPRNCPDMPGYSTSKWLLSHRAWCLTRV